MGNFDSDVLALIRDSGLFECEWQCQYTINWVIFSTEYTQSIWGPQIEKAFRWPTSDKYFSIIVAKPYLRISVLPDKAEEFMQEFGLKVGFSGPTLN